MQSGNLTPLQLSHLVHFATVVSFERAAQFLRQHHGVSVSASTSRRKTEAIGVSAEAVQNEQEKVIMRQKDCLSEKETLSDTPRKQVISPDGSFISLRRNVFAEVKTVVLGDVEENKKRSSQRPHQEVKMINISYFSRMTDAQTFTELASGEIVRRGFLQAEQVGAVSDGAEWIGPFIAAYRTDTVRILDFYHAAEYLSDIAECVKNAGTKLKETWFDEQCHELKYNGPKKVLEEVHHLLRNHPQIEELERLVNYLQKREQMMQYPLFRAEGWPIGSGSAESSHTSVVQSRMCGAGMHWEPCNVNPMLALRIGLCNERWEETRNQVFHHQIALKYSH